jgi:hypothetical protein
MICFMFPQLQEAHTSCIKPHVVRNRWDYQCSLMQVVTINHETVTYINQIICHEVSYKPYPL